MPVIRSFLPTVFAASALSLSFGCGTPSAVEPARAAATWTRLSQQDFPAQVNAVNWERGTVLDRNNRDTYGQWTLAFLPGMPPVATDFGCGTSQAGRESCAFVIRNLVAVNPIEGSKDVHIIFHRDVRSGHTFCYLASPPVDPLSFRRRFFEHPETRTVRPILFDNRCPTSVTFG